MDASRPRRSPATERFLGLFDVPSHSPSSSAGDELHEDDLLFSAPASDPPPDSARNPSRVPHIHFGLLAALHDGDKKLLLRRGGGGGAAAAAAATAASAGALLRRKATIAAAAVAVAASTKSTSTSPSPTSGARAIPAMLKPKNSGPAVAYYQSLPVKVPVRPSRGQATRRWDEIAAGGEEEDELLRGDAAMLPPHEMVARASAGAATAAPFSMLEGAGRTLKGRDLRRVRDAVLRQTGFID